MDILNVDVAVIGAGTAGLAAYKAARSHGKRVALIEGGPYGTTCARVGCMPSKLLIAAAESAHAVNGASAFGVRCGEARVDGRAVMQRVHAERDRFVNFVLAGIDKISLADRVRGYARFVDGTTLQVDNHTTVNAGAVVIATGSRPQLPSQLLALGDRLIGSDTVFEWEDLPESIAVIGAGVIALELGQALHRLGVRVRLFGRSDGIAHLGDPEVNQAAVSALGDELDIQLRATLLEASRDGGGAVLRWRGGDGIERTDRYSCVLAATGRVPNIASLELRNGGVLLDAHGLPQYDPDTLQCDGSGIFIAGDVTDQRLLLHDAAAQGRTAGDNAGRYPEIKPGLRHAPLAIAFTDPQMASVGARYSDLPPGRFAIGQVSFEDQGRSRVMRKNRGLLRVYGEHGSGRFLGAEMVAPHAEHLAHLLAWACQAGMSVAQILEMPYYHPTIEEGVRTALRDLKEQLLHGLPEIEHCTDCTPGM